MKRLSAILALLVALLPSLTFASSIGNAEYKSTIIITNNSTTTTNVSTNFTLSVPNLITLGMLSADASDCAIQNSSGNDTAFMPGYGTNPWMTWCSSVGTSAQVTQYLYSKGVTGGKLRYFPGSAGMTIASNTTLEPSSNFTVELDGYVDTTAGANKYLVNKPGSLSIYNDLTTSGKIHVLIPTSNSTVNLATAGAGDNTSITSVIGAATHWEAVQTNDSDTSYVSTTSTTYLLDTYTTNASSLNLPSGSVINAVAVITIRRSTTANNALLKPVLRLGGIETVGSEVTSTPSTSYITDNQTLVRPGGGSWSLSDLASLQIGAYLADTGAEGRLTQVYAQVLYSPPTLSTTAVSSGEHTVTVTGNATALYLTVDTTTANTTAATVPSNSNNWTIALSAAMPYMNTYKEYVGGTLKASIAWQYDTLFYDASGNGNTATPSFATTSSNANVSAVVSSQAGLLTGPAVITTPSGGSTMITSVPSTPATLYTAGTYIYPGATLITAWAVAAGQPPIAFHYTFIFGLSLLAMILVYAKTHDTKMGQRGSLLLAVIAGLLVVVYFYNAGAVVGWVLIPYGLLGLALVVWRKSPSPID